MWCMRVGSIINFILLFDLYLFAIITFITGTVIFKQIFLQCTVFEIQSYNHETVGSITRKTRNLFTKTCPILVTFRSFFKILKNQRIHLK